MADHPRSEGDAPLPALRSDLDAFPVEHEGKPVFVLDDREGLSGRVMALSPGGMLVASLLDGRHTADELCAIVAEHAGAPVDAADIRKIVEELEGADLLETERVRAKRRKILEDFKTSPVRKAVMSGAGYPESALELAGLFGGFMRDPKGPGKALPERPASAPPPLGLVSPHIDFQRGGPAYAWAYQALAESPPPDLIVALGVAHAGPKSPWIMTPKAYETPHGPMAVDSGLYDEIAGCLWYDPRDDEWAHRREHSLEAQAVWLRFLWREKTPPWVPILCSSFERFSPDRPPSSVSTIEGAIEKIGDKLAARAKGGQRIMVLAGVDLAHVGPRFGDDIALDAGLEKRIETEDRGSLEHALRLDADEFYRSTIAGGHWRKVCGLSALYTSLRWIKALSPDGRPPGELLTYAQSYDPLGGIVSYVSAIFR
ncbi:MAG: AmmeMemoRadiSam system protein B [Elusimicrobiota bacterium]